MHISELEKLFPVKFELYGFDSGEGLPIAKDYRDFPYYFNSRQFAMNVDQLRSHLKRAEIVIGNVKDTCQTFFDKYNPAPIGCIFNDLDYYSSTRDSFNIFSADNRHFLPRVFMYFDDIIGDNTWLPSEFAGELLAVHEFNFNNSTKKIAANRAMPAIYPDQWWVNQIYIYHDFDHRRYNDFVASEEQRSHEAHIRRPLPRAAVSISGGVRMRRKKGPLPAQLRRPSLRSATPAIRRDRSVGAGTKRQILTARSPAPTLASPLAFARPSAPASAKPSALTRPPASARPPARAWSTIFSKAPLTIPIGSRSIARRLTS